MKDKKFILKIVIMTLISAFSIYEIVMLAMDLACYSADCAKSQASLISGIVLFGIILAIALGIIIYLGVKKYQKKYYVLKK